MKLEKFEIFLSYLPLQFLALWTIQTVVGMLTRGLYIRQNLSFIPSYHISTGEWQFYRGVNGCTVLGFATIYIVCYYVYSNKRPLVCAISSGLLALFSMIHYEFWWHVGLEYSLKFERGMQQIPYWGMFTVMLGLGLFYVHTYFNTITLSRYKLLCAMYIVFMCLWGMLQFSFFPHFYDDIHGPIIYIGKYIGMVMWLAVITPRGNK